MKGTPTFGARARVRLLRLAKERGDDFQLVLLRFVHKRLLYRLASSRTSGRGCPGRSPPARRRSELLADCGRGSRRTEARSCASKELPAKSRKPPS